MGTVPFTDTENSRRLILCTANRRCKGCDIDNDRSGDISITEMSGYVSVYKRTISEYPDYVVINQGLSSHVECVVLMSRVDK